MKKNFLKLHFFFFFFSNFHFVDQLGLLAGHVY